MKITRHLIKNVAIAVLLAAALYIIYIFAAYWDVIVEAFMAGWESV
ncbi:MAG: hypothetical protein IKU18_06520 [Bacteroidales bacterium]|nr:hypothetical protein [Bacteroidales bacterium]